MFYYFGYGSNLSETALRAKRVRPVSAEPATLEGWRLAFNIPNFFSIEGGTGNIVRQEGSVVHGVLYGCEDQDLSALDEIEALGVAYSRESMTVCTYTGHERTANVYVGLPSIVSEGLKPSKRYLNILIQGAENRSLDPNYISQIRCTEVCLKPRYGPFVFPDEPNQVFTREDVATHAHHTAIAGAVFDMSDARVEHGYLRELLGGRDVTLFFLRRMDTSDSSETWEQIESGNLSPLQKEYLNDYLHQFNREYRYVGRTAYAETLHSPSAPSIRRNQRVEVSEIAARRVLRTAELTNRALGHENLGFLSEQAGFMPTITPLAALPPEFAAWDDVIRDLTNSYAVLGVRRAIDGLPLLDPSSDLLPDRYLLRAAGVLSMMAHAYWYCETRPPEKLPEAITKPWQVVRKRLQRPDEVLSYIDLIVYNWRLVDPSLPDPMRAENMRLLYPTVDNREERTFYLTQTEILAQAGPVIGAIVRAQEAVAHDDPKGLAGELLVIIAALQRIVGESLLNLNPNPASGFFVNPIVWAKTVAPFAVPLRDGSLGPSGTSSPIFNLLDIFFGRSKNETFLGREIRQLRGGYPLFWREFLGSVGEISVGQYVATVGDASLSGLLKDAVEIYAGDNGFLGRHRMKVYGYLEQAFKVGRSVTIGGFSGVFKDRTWDTVDTELENAREERLQSFPRGCHHATVHSVGQTHSAAPEGVKHVVLNVEGRGVRYLPGDRCGVLPENRDALVARTLEALEATGHEKMALTPEWISAVRLRWGYENATDLTLRDLLRFGRIRPVLPRMAEALQAATQNQRLLRAILQQTTTRWELWDLLLVLKCDGYDPRRLWQAAPRSAEHICRIVPPESFRMYSISSVKESRGREGAKEIELTVGRVHYFDTAGNGEQPERLERLGTASNFLACAAGRREPISIIIDHPARFCLPKDDTVPLVIVAGGTGISPMRSFILERARQPNGGHCHLFLACRSYEDFYYQDELLHWVDRGKLTLHIAFSREDVAVRYQKTPSGSTFVRENRPRRRIQDMLLADELAEELERLLAPRREGGRGAHVYLCGRSRFGRTVHEAFRELLSRPQRGTRPERLAMADQLLNQMVGEGRYMQEIFTDARTWDLERREINLSELVERNSYDQGHWLLVDGLVYDVSDYIQQHPGGTHVIRGYTGTDATLGYKRAHGDRSEVDATREMHNIGQLRLLDFESVTRTVESGGRQQNVALSTLYRAWRNLTFLVVEMQNALLNDQSLQASPTLRGEGESDRSLYKLQRAVETHERFLRSYLDHMVGETVSKLWSLVRGMVGDSAAQAAMAPDWFESRVGAVRSEPRARMAEGFTLSLHQQVRQLSNTGAPERSPERKSLRRALDDVFAEDRRFLKQIKALLREGLLAFEAHEARVLERAGTTLLELVGRIPGLVEAYYASVAKRCESIGWVPTRIPSTFLPAVREESSMRVLISTAYWLMEEDAVRKVVILRRHAVPVDSLDELLTQNREITNLMRSVDEEFGIVIDMRQAPSRNDPEFEDAMAQLRAEIFRHYTRVAVLVSSALGVLQVNRINRNDGAQTFATQNEAEAVRFAACA